MPQRRGSRIARHTYHNVVDNTRRVYRSRRLTYEQSPSSNPRSSRYMSRTEFYRQRAHRDALNRRNLEHYNRYQGALTYHTSRNTSRRQTILPAAPERGLPGPQGPRGAAVQGPRGVPGSNGLDGNADFMLLDAVWSSQNNVGTRLYNINWSVNGSVDMLADHRVFKNIRTNQGYNSNLTVDIVSLLFKPGIYKVTWTGLPQSSTTFGTVFGFDKNHNNSLAVPTSFSGDDGNTLYWSAGKTATYSIVESITSNTNFHFISRDTDTWRNVETIHPQLMIERIGYVEPSGTDQVLTTPNGGSETDANFDSTIIDGGITWGQSYQAPPSTHHPSTHPSQGGSNEWAVIELAADTAQTSFGWIHRVKRFI